MVQYQKITDDMVWKSVTAANCESFVMQFASIETAGINVGVSNKQEGRLRITYGFVEDEKTVYYFEDFQAYLAFAMLVSKMDLDIERRGALSLMGMATHVFFHYPTLTENGSYGRSSLISYINRLLKLSDSITEVMNPLAKVEEIMAKGGQATAEDLADVASSMLKVKESLANQKFAEKQDGSFTSDELDENGVPYPVCKGCGERHPTNNDADAMRKLFENDSGEIYSDYDTIPSDVRNRVWSTVLGRGSPYEGDGMMVEIEDGQLAICLVMENDEVLKFSLPTISKFMQRVPRDSSYNRWMMADIIRRMNNAVWPPLDIDYEQNQEIVKRVMGKIMNEVRSDPLMAKLAHETKELVERGTKPIIH